MYYMTPKLCMQNELLISDLMKNKNIFYRQMQTKATT